MTFKNKRLKKDAGMTENKVDVLISRIMGATGISSQAELAKELGINRSGITHARNKNHIPDNWIVKLFRRFRVNPEWVETGKGPVFYDRKIGDDIDGFRRIPKVAARLSAGTGSFECDQQISQFLCFPLPGLPVKALLPPWWPWRCLGRAWSL